MEDLKTENPIKEESTINQQSEETTQSHQDKMKKYEGYELQSKTLPEVNISTSSDKLFDMYDQDKNGTISSLEFSKIIKDIYGMHHQPDPCENDIQYLYDMFDFDDNGTFTREEWKKALKFLCGQKAMCSNEVTEKCEKLQSLDWDNYKLSFKFDTEVNVQLELKQLYSLYDRDKDGKISSSELSKFMADFCKIASTTAPTEKDIEYLYFLYDKNTDGFIYEEEFKMMCDNIGSGKIVTRQQVKKEKMQVLNRLPTRFGKKGH